MNGLLMVIWVIFTHLVMNYVAVIACSEYNYVTDIKFISFKKSPHAIEV